jgi:hypothetical protein
VDAGRLVVIGVVQEQHPDRARLYKQWRRLDWPIHVDALNELGHRVVPIPLGIDPHGCVAFRGLRSKEALAAFVAGDGSATKATSKAVLEAHPGDAPFHAGKLDEAIAAYRKDGDATAKFRLGVALRRRYESDARRPGDAQAAIDAWTAALALQPNQYIWRRRLQQYGPLLDKPYNFYGWVHEARAAIRARGEEPVPLAVEPRGSEILARGARGDSLLHMPDPEGKVTRDEAGLVAIETMVTPARVRPGRLVRVRLTFRLDKAYWNNEAGALVVFVREQGPLDPNGRSFDHPNAEKAETQEERIVEFDVEVAEDAPAGAHELKAYALYNVCEDEAAVCRYLRRDLAVTVTVDPKAPSLR